MTINPIRQTLFWSSIRATPFLVLFYTLILSISYPNLRNLLFLLSYCINFVINGVSKIGFKFIYNQLNIDKLPILGFGSRPPGATNCATFLKWPNTPAITFGMPSGHSQHAWFFATFIILELCRYYKLHTNSNSTDNLNTHNNIYFTDNIITKHPIIIVILSLLLIAFASLVSYSRISIDKCHTIQQVIVGAIIGIGLAFLSHWTISIILK